MSFALLASMLVGFETHTISSVEQDVRIDRPVCGYHSLFLVAKFAGADPSSEKLKTLLPPEKAPYSIGDLERAATACGMETFAAKWKSKHDATFSCPAILHVRSQKNSTKPDHFIACFGEANGELCVADFPYAPRFVRRESVLDGWDGHALYVSRKAEDLESFTTSPRVKPASVALGVAVGLGVTVGLMFFPKLYRRFGSREKLKITKRRTIVASAILAAVALLAFAGFYWFERKSVPALQTDSDIQFINADYGDNERVQVSFSLRNTAWTPVTITDVVTGCTCISPEKLAGKAIKPGEDVRADFSVVVPKFGGRFQRIQVHHDGNGSPLEIGIQLQNAQSIPTLRNIINRRPTFFHLRDPTETKTLTIETLEEIDSSPWIQKVEASDPVVDIVLKRITEGAKPERRYVERKYDFQIGWKEIPKSWEFTTAMVLHTAEPKKRREVIGYVSSSKPPPLFRPSAVVLTPAHSTEKIVFLAGDPMLSMQEWRIANGATLPKGLIAQLNKVNGEQRLRLQLKADRMDREISKIAIPLMRADGITEKLKVFVDFSD